MGVKRDEGQLALTNSTHHGLHRGVGTGMHKTKFLRPGSHDGQFTLSEADAVGLLGLMTDLLASALWGPGRRNTYWFPRANLTPAQRLALQQSGDYGSRLQSLGSQETLYLVQCHLEETDEGLSCDDDPALASPEERACLHDALSRAIAAMTPWQRGVICFRLQGYSFADIARARHLSEYSVKNAYARAVNHIRRELL